MEVLASLLTSGQLGQLKELSQSVSLEEVAEVASSGFRSLSSTREDSLVFVLGLLNMATVLLYAVYADLFKPSRTSWGLGLAGDDHHFFYKKIQNILDELVLHVHTSTYYRNAIERSRLSSRFQGRSGEPFHGLLSFFEMPGLTSSSKDSPVLSRRAREDYDVYLKRESRKLMQEWISVLVQSTFAETLTGRLFKRHVSHHRSNVTSAEFKSRSNPSRTPKMNEQPAVARHLTKREANHQNRTGTRRMRPQAGRQSGAQRRMLPMSLQSKPSQQQQRVVESKNHSAVPMRRRPQVKQVEKPTTTTAKTTTKTTTTTTTTTTTVAPTAERFHRHQEVPALPVQGLFPHATVRQAVRGRVATPGPAKVVPGNRQQQQHAPVYYENDDDDELDLDVSGSSPSGVESSLVDRLMHLVQQSSPLAMDVLHVFKTQSDNQEPKCLERQLCQLNQEWKKKGIVSAALAPLLSISLGWWRDRATGPNLPDVLMAVRAGWIGKHCATLYPRCTNTARPQWVVVPATDDSANQQSANRPAIKVAPPFGFHNHQQQPAPTVRQPPGVTQSPPRPPMKTPPSTTPAPIRKKDETPPDWSGEDEETDERPVNSRLDDLSPSLSVASGSLHVNNVPSNGSVKGEADVAKPWGKPSRFPVPGNVELSDIVRGVYPPDQTENEADEEDDEEENDDEEEDEDDEDDEDGNNQSSTEKVSSHFTEEILHDLKKNHFSTTKAPATQKNDTKAADVTKSAELIKYEEMQKKKTHRLEMVPYRGLVHPWLADPVWASENRWPNKPAAKTNQQTDDESEATDRHRDRVSFSHEDAVKDHRIHDYAMQFLRDRSA